MTQPGTQCYRSRQSSIRPTFLGTQSLDQPSLSRGQQLREDGDVAAACSTDLERCVHIDADHVAARRQPHLSLAGEQHFPGLMLLLADQSVLAVGAELPVCSGHASGAGQVVVAAGPAVFGPSAPLEMPAAESPDPFFPRSATLDGA
jgi:hypothetical protein